VSIHSLECLALSNLSENRFPRVHIIHVGHMANKGTQALILSDFSVIKRITGGAASISVSTTDIQGVRKLGAAFSSILPTIIDIPYEQADVYAKRAGFSRRSVKYKIFAFGCLFNMFVQIIASSFSAVSSKAGLRPLFRFEIMDRIKECDVVVSCSDENFKESASMLPLNVYWILTWWSLLVSKTWEVLIARSFGKKVVMFPNSVGPFRTFVGRYLTKIALNKCDSVLVREPISKDEVENLKIKSNVILTSDTSLLFTSPKRKIAKKDAGRVIVVCPGVYGNVLSEREISRYVTVHAEALDKTIEKHDFSVLFLPHYVRGFRYDDLDISRLIFDKMKHANKAEIVEARSVEEFKSIIDGVDMVISSKLHPTVLASSGFVPSLTVAYDHKQTGFMANLGLSDCVLTIGEITSDRLLSKIEHVWNNRKEISDILKMRIPPLQKSVEESIRSALSRCVELPVHMSDDW
jgi:polysaccharide pyruvyl transferase WcaK-like protein